MKILLWIIEKINNITFIYFFNDDYLKNSYSVGYKLNDTYIVNFVNYMEVV